MTKQIRILLALCLLNGTLIYGWFRLKAREHTLQQQLNTFPTVRNELSKAEKRLQNCIFPWEDAQDFADTQMRFEDFFRNALQKNFVWTPKSTPSHLRNGVICHTGEVTAFFFYPRVRPLLEALAENDAPLWIRSMKIARNGLNNAGFKVSLVADVVTLPETQLNNTSPSNEQVTGGSLDTPPFRYLFD